MTKDKDTRFSKAVERQREKKQQKEHPTNPHLQTGNHLGSGRGHREKEETEMGHRGFPQEPQWQAKG